MYFGLAGHQWSGGSDEWVEGLEVFLYTIKMYLTCGLVLKKKLQPLIVEFQV